ncbi:hypothetical protein CAP2UW1_1337 [Candidatus Accumulibacter phosphatis]|uniref:Uncharacterized protein n=1 Tax=Accumulibacter regalis TaxID=522306 RepID=C7RSE8_ACCRE
MPLNCLRPALLPPRWGVAGLDDPALALALAEVS